MLFRTMTVAAAMLALTAPMLAAGGADDDATAVSNAPHVFVGKHPVMFTRQQAMRHRMVFLKRRIAMEEAYRLSVILQKGNSSSRNDGIRCGRRTA